jgi:hypothetical protein
MLLISPITVGRIMRPGMLLSGSTIQKVCITLLKIVVIMKTLVNVLYDEYGVSRKLRTV